MMEIDEIFHELNAAVELYYDRKRNSIEDSERGKWMNNIYKNREKELHEMLKATKEFLEWGATI
jgi:hypothetical protein